jgi:hypothetical protein
MGCAAVAVFILIGGCAQMIGIGDGDEQKTTDCAMAPAAHAGLPGLIGGGNGGGGRGGFTNGGGDSSSSTGGSSSSGDAGLDTDVPDYDPDMDPADVTPEMQDQAEIKHGETRTVGTELIWFDKRTGEPFPWHKKAYKKAKREADAVDKAAKASEEEC